MGHFKLLVSPKRSAFKDFLWEIFNFASWALRKKDLHYNCRPCDENLEENYLIVKPQTIVKVRVPTNSLD